MARAFPKSRRRVARRPAGRKGGREFFWLRFQPFTLSQWTTTPTLILSDIFVTESAWQNPSSDLNQTRKGGPRLERFIMNYGFGMEGDSNFWRISGEGNFNLIPEVMVHTQSDIFATTVTSSGTFDSVLQSERIVMHEVPSQQREFSHVDTDGGGLFRMIRTVQGRYESVSKVRLAERALAISLRSNFDANVASFRGFVDWFQPTLLISVP